MVTKHHEILMKGNLSRKALRCLFEMANAVLQVLGAHLQSSLPYRDLAFYKAFTQCDWILSLA